MRIFRVHINVLKKASGSWAEPYSLASLLALHRILVYRRYTCSHSGYLRLGKWYTTGYITI